MTHWNSSPPTGLAMPEDALLQGVLRRRCVAWLVDLALIVLVVGALWVALFSFGVLTLGFGLPLLGVLPIVPFCYHFFSLASPFGATPGQAMLGLRVVRDVDLGPSEPVQALLSTIGYYITLSTAGLLLLVALVTTRKRTLHDMLGGLVVVRARALTEVLGSWNMANGSPYA